MSVQMPDTCLTQRMRVIDLPQNGVIYVEPYSVRVDENANSWIMGNSWGYIEPIGPFSMRVQNTSAGYSIDVPRKCKYAPHEFSSYEKENALPISKISSIWETNSPLYPEFPSFY